MRNDEEHQAEAEARNAKAALKVRAYAADDSPDGRNPYYVPRVPQPPWKETKLQYWPRVQRNAVAAFLTEYGEQNQIEGKQLRDSVNIVWAKFQTYWTRLTAGPPLMNRHKFGRHLRALGFLAPTPRPHGSETPSQASLREDRELVAAFLAMRCRVPPPGPRKERCIPARDLHAAFVAWCKETGHHFPLSTTAFGRRLHEAGYANRQASTGHAIWDGIALVAPGSEPPSEPGEVSDEFSRFVRECCTLDPGARVPARDVVIAYNVWCELHHVSRRTRGKLADSLSARGISKQRTASRMWFYGVVLNAPSDAQQAIAAGGPTVPIAAPG